MPKIITFNHPNLTKKAKPVDFINQDLNRITEKIVKAMEKENGIGLAAPQIDISLQIVAIKTEQGPLLIYNPKITRKSIKKVNMEEGCLSFPGYFGIVSRPQKIRVIFYDKSGQKAKISAGGIFARVLQHEIDHLNGKLFVYKVKKFTKGNSDELWSKMRS